MPLPIDTALVPEELITQSPEKYIDQLINRVKIIHDLAKTNLEDAQLKSKTYYDKSTKIPNFKVGDHVLLKQEKVQIGQKKKLEPKWTGPFSILENRHNLMYKLLNLKTLRPVKSFIHANRLKAFKDPSDFRPPPNLLIDNEALNKEPGNINQPNPDNSNEDLNQAENQEDNSHSDVDESTSNQGQNKNDQWYEAIKLLKLKWISGKKYYLVQWKDNSNPTWEPQENVNQALKIAFHSEKAHKRLKRRRMPRFGFVTLPFLLFALLLSTSKADEQRINYGVIFQNQPNIDFATDYWTHIYEIPMYLNLQHKLVTKCPQGVGRQCQSYDKIVAQRDYKNLEEHYTGYFQILTDQSQDTITLQNYIIDLKTAIINLIEGKLSPLLLKPDVIKQTVSDIQNILNANYTGYKILTSNPHYYYDYAQYVVLQNNTKLYLAVQFPLTTHGKLFEVYKLKSFPVAVTTNTSHATQLFDLPKYMLITHDRKFFTTLTVEQMNMCQGITPKHCNFNLLFESSKTTECAFHIFNNDKQKIKNFCDFKFLPNSISPHIDQISEDSVLIYKYDILNLRCNDKNITVSADSMVDGQIDLNFEKWPTTNDILSLIAIIITSLNTFVLIWLFYKFKVIAAAIAIYQPVQTSATTLPNFKFQPATTQAPTTWINVLNSNITWDHAVFT
ncbi:unnamed protein product [Mytilus coruscus]|uniref:Chromo domain-containing protein n=1 Tax=Mytilus coruscus TaxID=42192 RepID=A0A6J8A339_MYTCO|nr:unnamed protein product [Mytilus coruscus]